MIYNPVFVVDVITGLWLVFLALKIDAPGNFSFIMFRFVPMILGLWHLFGAYHMAFAT